MAELSPKFQDHPVGLPVEVSVKVTVWPVVGEPGEKVKAAVGAGVVGGVYDPEGVPPPQPAITRQVSKRNSNRHIFIGISFSHKFPCKNDVYSIVFAGRGLRRTGIRSPGPLFVLLLSLNEEFYSL